MKRHVDDKVLTSTKIAIFVEHYLTISMTFVYRQMLGVMPDFIPIVICETVNNLETFPYGFIYSVDAHSCQVSLIQRISNKIRRILTNKYVLQNKKHLVLWKEHLKQHKCKLIHAHFGPNGIKILPLAKELNIPFIITFHGYDISKLLRIPSYVCQLRKLFEGAQMIIVVSEKMRKDAISLGCPEDKVVCHYIGIPVDEFREKEIKDRNGAIRLLQVSNFAEKKGHKYTIESFNEIIKKGISAHLIFVGDGPTRKDCQILVNKLGLNNYVLFMGEKPMGEISKIMNESDIFVHHSVTARDGDQEGIPTVIMEAMACSLPIISTYHSGIPELVINEKSGFLVEEKSVTGMVNKMETLCKKKDLRISMGRFGRKYVRERFNMNIQNKKLKDLYSKAIEWSSVNG